MNTIVNEQKSAGAEKQSQMSMLEQNHIVWIRLGKTNVTIQEKTWCNSYSNYSFYICGKGKCTRVIEEVGFLLKNTYQTEICYITQEAPRTSSRSKRCYTI